MKYSIYKYALLGCLALNVCSCGDKFEELPWVIIDKGSDEASGGDNESGSVSLEVLEGELMKGLRENIILYTSHAYQYARSNSIDVFAGYMTVSQNQFLFGGPLPSTYSVVGWQNYYTSPADKGIFKQVYNAYKYGESMGVPEWKAISMIASAYVVHECADFFGPYPFEDYRNLKETPPITYDPVDKIYDKLFNELKEAVRILNEKKPSAEMLRRIEGPDGGITNYNWQQWVKFANSIRLRMAMNIVKVDPTRAQAEAEAAVSDGVLEYTDEDFAYTYDRGFKDDHPLYSISVGWDDSRLGASLENILKRMRNPLLEVWFSTNPYPIYDQSGKPSGFKANSGYYGIRQGSAMINKSSKSAGYGMFSTFKIASFPKSLLKVTEVLFLRAEGALRNWNMGGEAKDFYEKGIRRSFEENGVASKVDAYLAQTDVDMVDFVDPYNRTNDIDGRVEVGVKWDDSDENELKLEKIITQKYIANFPMSAEAWTTFRRTGYPRLFPVDPEMNTWEDDINVEVQIRRIPYFSKKANEMNDINTSMVNALGGPNKTMTRIWWDIDTNEIDYSTEEGRVIPHNF